MSSKTSMEVLCPIGRARQPPPDRAMIGHAEPSIQNGTVLLEDGSQAKLSVSIGDGRIAALGRARRRRCGSMRPGCWCCRA